MNTIVIGSSREQKLPSLVLEHSIQRHTTAENFSIIHTWDKKFPSPKLPQNRSRTGFSFHRFSIPALAGYEGTGIYLECDQLVMADVRELFSIPFGAFTVLRPANQASVLALDCGRLKWDLQKILDDMDAGVFSYHDLMERLCIVPPEEIGCTIPGEWNSLERFDKERTKNLHYTNMSEQPWRKWGHPLRNLWLDELRLAYKYGRISLETIEEEVRLGFIVPQVLEALAE